jgi:hypothetical protein
MPCDKQRVSGGESPRGIGAIFVTRCVSLVADRPAGFFPRLVDVNDPQDLAGQVRDGRAESGLWMTKPQSQSIFAAEWSSKWDLVWISKSVWSSKTWKGDTHLGS